jgi:hypothetical protein
MAMTDREKLLTEFVTGTLSALAALADTMDQQGVMPKSAYRNTLVALWEQMPDQDAQAGEGMIFERLIDYLG